MSAHETDFRRILDAAGLVPVEIVIDGALHRCPTADKPHGRNGAYIGHADEPATLWWMNFRTGQSDTWTAKNSKEMSPAEREAFKARVERDRAAREEATAALHAEKAALAKSIWERAKPCPEAHPYLARKGVPPLGGLRIGTDGRVILPVLNGQGQMQSLQFIAEDGQKRFLTGGRLAGGFCPIGATKDKTGPLFVAEGYATGATIHMATGGTVLCAFNAGNLKPVVETARKLYPSREIIMCADDDLTEGNPGLTKATEAARAIDGKLAVPVFLDHAGRSDFNDMHAEQGLDAVKDALAAPKAPGNLSAGCAPAPLVVVDAAQLLTLRLPPREYVLGPVIPRQGLVMIYAPRGIGKTFVALSVAYAVASGQGVFRWHAPRPRRVLYLDGEMPANTMQERLAAIVTGYEHELPGPDWLRFITPDLQGMGARMPNLATPEGQAALLPYLEGVELVVVDNLATLARAGRENDSEGWLPVQEWILGLRQRGLSVCMVHHAGKGGQQRGTSSREDVLDTVIALRRPHDYQQEEGARFEVHLEKARGICGDDAKSFEAILDCQGDALVWRCRDIEDVRLAQVKALHSEGMKVRDIAEETGIPKSTVHRLVKKLEAA